MAVTEILDPVAHKSPLDRLLGLVAEVHAGEAATALLLGLTGFLILAAYYVIRPYPQAGSLAAVLENEGKFGVAGNSVTYPAIAALPDGRGIVSFTLIGPDYYPSAAYIRFNDSGINGNVRVAAAGKGPEDGFSGYLSLTNPPSNVARWGDYGAAALSGGTFWMASEYIGQVCTLQEFLTTNFRCGQTRGAFGNWYTRVTEHGERPQRARPAAEKRGPVREHPVGRRRAPPDDAEPGQHRRVVLGDGQVRHEADPIGPAGVE